jgi:hypothetical protein
LNNNKINSFDFGIDIGSSILMGEDKSLASGSYLVALNSKIPLNVGLNLTWNFLKKKRVNPKLSLGVNTFRTKASDLDTNSLVKTISFSNRFISLNGSFLMQHDIGIGAWRIPLHYGVFLDKSVFLISKAKRSDTNVGAYENGFYRGPFIMGSVVGFSVPIKKINLGLFYYQRLYFTGFNREISRVMLRVCF